MRIFTHSGLFHADDAMAVAMVEMLCNREDYCGGSQNPEVIRVRQLPEDFNAVEDIALDVGGKCDDRSIFDHHQKGGNDDGRAAAGKFWRIYGPLITGSTEVANRVYQTLIGAIDRADIGVPDWQPVRDDWQHVSLSGFIAGMNPPMGSPAEMYNAAFDVAVAACAAALKGAIDQARSFCKMRNVVMFATRPCPEVLYLKTGGPWQEHVLQDRGYDDILFVVYPSERGGFCVQAVPAALGSFQTRKSLPKDWWGLRGEELAKAAKMGCFGPATFCHPNGFIGGAETIEDAVLMAKKAV
jgi:uncharacterized UPF0160 family protein